MISVLIPAFNAACHVEEAVHSVLDQTCDGPIDLVIVNDGSTDGTGQILDALAARHRAIRVFHSANFGVSHARNRLMAERDPSSEFVTFLDADDAFPSGRLQRDIELLRRDPLVQMVYGRLRLVPSQELPLVQAASADDIMLRGISVTTATFRSTALDRIGTFETGMTHGEDLDFLLRFFETSPGLALLDDVSVLYRQHAGTATSDHEALRRGVMHALLRHGRRLRNDPGLKRVDGIFEMDRLLAAAGAGSAR